MCFVPDRYYLGLFYLDLPRTPKNPHGGNITFQIWRMADEPSHWHVTYRFRYYVDDSGNPDAPDRRTWWHMETDGDEATIQDKFQKVVFAWSGITSTKASAFFIRGDADKAIHLLRTSPPDWLHMSMLRTE